MGALVTIAVLAALTALEFKKLNASQSLFVWLHNGQRWHDLGHFFAQFCFTSVFLGLGLQFPLVLGATVASALLVEFIQGFEFTELDFYHDIALHLAGGACAILNALL